MTPRTKEILRECLFIYHVTPNKQPLIDKVKENLSIHYNGINSIGIGLDDDKVRAGEIFLRINKKKIKHGIHNKDRLRRVYSFAYQ